MTPVKAAQPTFRIELDHADQLYQAFLAVTIDPIKSIAYYAFPILGAFFSGGVELRLDDPAQEAMIPRAAKEFIFREIQAIADSAGIRRGVTLYSGLLHSFSSCGGAFSFTKPVLFVPHQHLFRTGKSLFTQEKKEENLAGDLWRYSDDETRFLIAREMGRIAKNKSLLRIAVRVAIIALIFLFFATPLSFLTGLALSAAGAGLHLISERASQADADLTGIDILTKRVGNNRARAVDAAVSALEKMRKQNLARREQNKLCRWYITKSGNNLLDLAHPPLTSRIAKCAKRLSQDRIWQYRPCGPMRHKSSLHSFRRAWG